MTRRRRSQYATRYGERRYRSVMPRPGCVSATSRPSSPSSSLGIRAFSLPASPKAQKLSASGSPSILIAFASLRKSFSPFRRSLVTPLAWNFRPSCPGPPRSAYGVCVTQDLTEMPWQGSPTVSCCWGSRANISEAARQCQGTIGSARRRISWKRGSVRGDPGSGAAFIPRIQSDRSANASSMRSSAFCLALEAPYEPSPGRPAARLGPRLCGQAGRASSGRRARRPARA